MIECPYCQTALPSEDAEWVTCETCHKRLNAGAQQVYARAKAAYIFAQDRVLEMASGRIPGGNIYRAKTRLDLDPLAPDIAGAYQQAYAGLHLAFHFDLPDHQRISGIEMLAGIARVFAPRAMMSPLEAEYWTKLMIEVTTRRELQVIEDRLTHPSYSIAPGVVDRWRWRVRRYQLRRAVDRLRAKITDIERAIGFLTPPHVH